MAKFLCGYFSGALSLVFFVGCVVAITHGNYGAAAIAALGIVSVTGLFVDLAGTS